MMGIGARISALLFACALAQENPGQPVDPASGRPVPPEQEARTLEWKEGIALPVRVPVASPTHQFMTTLAFPEDSIETAITGWAEGDLTAVQKRGLLFLRLTRRSEGQLHVIGGSGTPYLLTLKGIEHPETQDYDAYLKIKKKEAPRIPEGLPRRRTLRPTGSLELLQAMRQGLRLDGVRILRAKHELAYESPSLEVRLAYVYDAPAFRGYLYDLKNKTGERQSIDASRLRGKGTSLILTALRENVLDPQGATRLYAVAWKD